MTADILKKIEFFSALSPKELEALAELTLRKTHRKGTYIHAEGQKNDKLHIIVSGEVEVVKVTNSKEVVLGRIGAGGFYGEMSMFIPPTIRAAVKAVEDTEVLSLPHEALKMFFDKNPAVGTKILWDMMKTVCLRLNQVNEKYGATMFFLSKNFKV